MPFALLLAVVGAHALTETPPLPQGGQLDHFSYSIYLDDKKAKRFHFPRLRLPASLRGVQVDLDPKVARKAVPLLAAAVAELPAVREELRERLGKDLAPHLVAKEALGRVKEEASKLGSQLEGTALELARQVRGLVNGVAEEVNETVVMAEHAAEEILHHSEPPKRSHGWIYWTLGLALLGFVGYRHSRRGPRRPTGTRGRGTASPPRRGSNSVLPLAPRESVMQRAPSFSSLTPVRVNKVEFQRVEVTAPEWDSPSEYEKDSADEGRHEGGLDMGKATKTEYYQISSRQDTPPITSPRDHPRDDRALGA